MMMMMMMGVGSSGTPSQHDLLERHEDCTVGLAALVGMVTQSTYTHIYISTYQGQGHISVYIILLPRTTCPLLARESSYFWNITAVALSFLLYICREVILLCEQGIVCVCLEIFEVAVFSKTL